MDLIIQYWPIVLVGTLAALFALFLLLRPRQRVSLTDNRPLRPHMVAASPIDQIEQHSAQASAADSDLTRLKGVGPKLAAMLSEQGVTRVDQLALFTPPEIAALDSKLGAFSGRLARDHVVEQAALLARGDIDGFERRFGKL